MSLTDFLQPKETEAVARADNEQFPLVAICSSNDPELLEPAPLDAKLSTQQVRDIFWRSAHWAMKQDIPSYPG